MFGKSFWINLFERAISTFAQAAIGILSAGSLGLLQVNWVDVASVAGLAALLSVLKSFSVAAVPSGDSAPKIPVGTAKIGVQVVPAVTPAPASPVVVDSSAPVA
jgi:hypothetical protein